MASDPWLPERLRRLSAFVAGENQVRESWLGAAGAWAGRVIGAVMGPFRQAGQVPDAGMVTSQGDYWQQQLRERLRPSLLDLARTGWAQAVGAPAPALFDQSQQAQQYLTDSVNRMVRTPDEVYREIAAIVADGLNAGESVPDIAARVDQALTVAGNENWTGRATVVARTEAAGAMNFGSYQAGLAQQEADGAPYDKLWLATVGDGRTRPSHREADGQRVPLGQPFTVGDAALLYPGDPTGPAGEVIQCRCAPLILRADEPTTSLINRQFLGGE